MRFLIIAIMRFGRFNGPEPKLRDFRAFTTGVNSDCNASGMIIKVIVGVIKRINNYKVIRIIARTKIVKNYKRNTYILISISITIYYNDILQSDNSPQFI